MSQKFSFSSPSSLSKILVALLLLGQVGICDVANLSAA